MIKESLAHPAHESTNCGVEDQWAAKLERELERLKAARPRLRNRIARAENLLVTQLSVIKIGQCPIKVRVHRDGSRSYTVRSGSKLRRTYAVDPHTWSCNCPWQANGGTSCYHSIAAWALWRCYPPPSKWTQLVPPAPPVREPEGSDEPSLRSASLGRPERLDALAERLGVA